MIYLSQLMLNPNSRMAQNDSRSAYEMHRTLLKAFNCCREEANVLYRQEVEPYSGMISLLVQSTAVPNWQPIKQAGQGCYLLSPPACKSVALGLQNGRILQFRLRANPTKRKSSGKGNKPGPRIQLVHEEAQRSWLRRKADAHGFHILDAQINPEGKQTDYGKKLTIYTMLVNGRLQITDAALFETAVQKGIGPAKAFGCGLLSLAPG